MQICGVPHSTQVVEIRAGQNFGEGTAATLDGDDLCIYLKRLLGEYVRYYHDDRTHLGLQKETPGRRKTLVRTGDPRRGVDAEARRLAPSIRSSCLSLQF
jgi:hypothetical protein